MKKKSIITSGKFHLEVVRGGFLLTDIDTNEKFIFISITHMCDWLSKNLPAYKI